MVNVNVSPRQITRALLVTVIVLTIAHAVSVFPTLAR